MSKSRKMRCPHCGFLDTIKKGKRAGYSRYYCKKVCLILYRDSNIKMTILYRLAKREALRDLKEDLRAIIDVGIEIESVTCDGATNIIKAVQEVCPEAIIQRCTSR